MAYADLEQKENNDESKIFDDELEWTTNFVDSFPKEDEHGPLDRFSDNEIPKDLKDLKEDIKPAK